MVKLFDPQEFSSGFFTKGPAELLDIYFRPWTYHARKDGSRVVTHYRLAAEAIWQPDEMDEPVTVQYTAGSLSAKPESQAEAQGRGWFPSHDGETYVGEVDLETIYEMASDGAVDEFDEEEFANDEDWRGPRLAPVPDADGNEPEELAGGTGFHKFVECLMSAEGAELLEGIDMDRVDSLIGMRADLAPIDKGEKGPPMPIVILEGPSGGGGKTKGSKKGKSSKGKPSKTKGSKSSKAKSSKTKKSAGKKSAAKKSADIDEDKIEAAIVEALEASDDGELTTPDIYNAARGVYDDAPKKERSALKKAAMALCESSGGWIDDEDRPWEFQDGVLRPVGGFDEEDEDEDDED